MDEINPLELQWGDVLTSGTLLWEDTPTKRVWLIRNGDEIIVRTEWKGVAALLDANRAEANEFSRTGKLTELVKVASVPIGLHMQWQAEGITKDTAAIARRLNDGDYSKFRTNTLRV